MSTTQPIIISQEKPKKANGITKHAMTDILTISAIGCLVILGIMVLTAVFIPNIVDAQVVFDSAHMIIVMVLGASLALAKDVLNPRREITIEQVIELADKISTNNNTTDNNQNKRQ